MGRFGVYILSATVAIVIVMTKRRGHVSGKDARRLIDEGAAVPPQE